MERYAIPLLLTLLAGLSTGVGSLLALLFKGLNAGVMRLMMGFSAGVMIYVSFTELLGRGIDELGFMKGNLAFFGGIVFIALIDFLVPHEYLTERIAAHTPKQSRLLKAGLFTGLGLMIHNFPEGMAVFASAVQETSLGISLAVAIAIHNIPEGIAVALPIYAATGKRRQAFFYSFISGIAEPIGALIGLGLLLPYLNGALLGGILAAVGGLMTFISFDEILPISYMRDDANGEVKLAHEAIVGVVTGMAVMALSLALF